MNVDLFVSLGEGGVRTPSGQIPKGTMHDTHRKFIKSIMPNEGIWLILDYTGKVLQMVILDEIISIWVQCVIQPLL